MGRRGPPPTPTKILALRGSWLAKTRPNEPVVPVEKPSMPDFLGDEAKGIWRKVTTQLYRAGLLAKVDGWMLARYCVLWVEWQHAGSWLTEYGQAAIKVTAEGRPLAADLWPQARLLMALSAELRRIEQHFGMSPSARAALGSPAPKASNDADQDAKAKFFRSRV